MSKFKVITTEKKKNYKPDRTSYVNALSRLAWENKETFGHVTNEEMAKQYPDVYRKYLYLNVKICGGMKSEELDYVNPEKLFELFSDAVQLFQYITPKELLQMFPPVKEYDGKGEWKDYSTMKAIALFPMDEPLGEEDATLHILMDYMNRDINFFMVNWMGAVSRMRVAQGGMDPTEEFLQKQGIPTYTLHEKEGYLYNRMTGKTVKVKKPKRRRPKYIRKVR